MQTVLTLIDNALFLSIFFNFQMHGFYIIHFLPRINKDIIILQIRIISSI